MIYFQSPTANLLDAEVEAIVNPVNCVGVMGKGLALQFKRHYPWLMSEYARDCRDGLVQIGRLMIYEVLGSKYPRFVINFPTKQHWRNPSKISYIREGMSQLVADILSLNIRSIAIPALGCGAGGLDWAEVEPLIRDKVVELHSTKILLYPPR